MAAAAPHLAEATLGPLEQYNRNFLTGNISGGVGTGSPEIANFARAAGNIGDYPVVQSDLHGEGLGIDVGGIRLYSGISAQSAALRSQEASFGENSGPQFMGRFGDEAAGNLIGKIMRTPGAASAIRRIASRRGKFDQDGKPMVTAGEVAAELGILDQVAPTQKTRLLLGISDRDSTFDEGA